MLGLYIKSTIVYLIIYWALKKTMKTIMLSREDVNYKDYKGKGIYYTFAFIPILRILIILIVFFITFAPKETLDKLFKRTKTEAEE